MKVWPILAVLLTLAGAAEAGSDKVRYGPRPAWAAPPPAATTATPAAGAATHVLYADSQTRLGPDGDETHQAYRIRLTSPEALALGNLSATWSPDTDEITVHALKVHRDGAVIDVLKTASFTILQRENNLENAALDGDLTASLQVPGLQVGDELEFSVTIRSRDPLLGDRSQGVISLPAAGAPGVYRVRLLWPRTHILRWKATPDLGALAPKPAGDSQELLVELRDPATAITADGAPSRVNLRRLIQYSGFADWGAVSAALSGPLAQASTLPPASPVRAEAAKLAAAHADPAARAAAALRLVQERIRYVYVDLNGGNYRAASADETWTRRFGDCKAKTALLLALLRELGVPAEAVLVSSAGGDGTDAFLPMLGAFNHMLVKATIDGRAHWLDGTRLGDRALGRIPSPAFAWALPVRTSGGALERVERAAPVYPLDATVLEIDARAGVDAPAKVSVEQLFRGDEAVAYKTVLAQASSADAERLLKSYFVERYDWVEAARVSWTYDEAQNTTTFRLSGEGTPEWEGDADDGRRLYLPNGGFGKPAALRRPSEQDQAAPWLTEWPDFTRRTTIVRLPPAVDGWNWALDMDPLDVSLGGAAYRRDYTIEDGVLRITKSRRTLTPEISATEAQASNGRRADFDDGIPRLYQRRERTAAELEPQIAAALKMTDKTADDFASLGYAFLTLDQKASAVRAFDRALVMDAASERALLGKAGLLESDGDTSAALALYERAARRRSDPEAALQYGAALIRAGRKDEGLAILDPLPAAHPHDAGLHAEVANQMLSAGRTERAAALVEAGQRLPGEEVRLHQLRGALAARAKRWPEALAAYDAALAAEPESLDNLRNRAIALKALARHDDALADMDEALRIDPEASHVVSLKARTLRAAGRRQDAIAIYNREVERDRTAHTLNNRCYERALAGQQLAEAEADCAESLKLRPDSASTLDSYGFVALRRERYEEAVQRFDRALKLNPKLAWSLYGRGVARIRRGDEPGGRADIAASIALDPDAAEELTEAGVTP